MTAVSVTRPAICPHGSLVAVDPDADAVEVAWLLSAVVLAPKENVSICAVATDASTESAAMDLMMRYYSCTNSKALKEGLDEARL